MNCSIILAEDEIAGKRWQKFLQRKGHLVMLYENGMALCKDIYEGLKYDIAFVDLSLPKVDGDVIAHLSKELNPKVPVVTMSGYGYVPKCSNMHLTKPITPEILEKIVNEFQSSLSEERQKQP